MKNLNWFVIIPVFLGLVLGNLGCAAPSPTPSQSPSPKPAPFTSAASTTSAKPSTIPAPGTTTSAPKPPSSTAAQPSTAKHQVTFLLAYFRPVTVPSFLLTITCILTRLSLFPSPLRIKSCAKMARYFLTYSWNKA